MYKSTSRLITGLFLILSLTIAAGANASLVKLTVTGTFLDVNTDPVLGTFGTYGNVNGTIPFARPAEGTVVTFSTIVDTASLSGNPTGTPVGTASFDAQSATMSFGSFSTVTNQAGMTILNDIPTSFLAPSGIQQRGVYVDLWHLYANLPNGNFFGISLVEGSDSTPIGALSDANFINPELSAFTDRLMFYYGEGGLGNDYMILGIDSIVAQPVPVPAAAWLFGSALLSLFGIKRNKAHC